MIFLSKIKFYLVAIGAGILAVLTAVLRMKSLKRQRDNARHQRDVLDARVHVQQVQKSIAKKNKEALSKERVIIKEEVSKKGEAFEGIDSLENPNDF